MADASQYFVDPDSGRVRIVKPEMVDEAIARNFTPATDEQRKQYDLLQASKRDPLGGAKEFGQALGEGVAGLAGLPAALMTLVPSAAELEAKKAKLKADVDPEAYRRASEAAEVAKRKRFELAGEMARYTTMPGLQQEFGLRTAQEIEAGAEAHPYARGAGTILSLFTGAIAGKVLKAAATKAVPLLAAEQTAAAATGLSNAAARAAGIEAKNAVYLAAQSELAAAEAAGDAAEIAIKRAALEEAAAVSTQAYDDAAKITMALSAESGVVPEALAPIVGEEAKAAGAAARKAAKRMSASEAARLLVKLPRGQKIAADVIKKLDSATVTSGAITSKFGNDLAQKVEQQALRRLERTPGFSTTLAEADLALAKSADDVAVGAQKEITEAAVAKAEQNLATLKARQEIVAKTIGLGLGRSPELMLFGLQGVANEAALGDPALVAESAYGTLGFDAGLGAAMGVAEAILPPTLKAGVRAAKGGGRKLSDVMRRLYVNVASTTTGAEPEIVEAVLGAGERLEARGLRGIIEDATPMPKMADMPPELPAPAVQPLKKIDVDATAKEFRTALEDDVRQIATPAPGGLLYDANTQWRKVQLGQSIEQHAQQLGTDAPMRAALDDAITLVENTRNKILSSEGLGLEPGQVMPQETAQKSAYLVSRALGDVEKRLVAFKEGMPNPSNIHQELKWIADELYGYMKKYGLESRDLKLIDRQSNAAYAKLRGSIVDIVTNENTWGQAGALEAQWRQDARAYYAALDNLKATAPKDLMRLLKDKDGRKTVLVIDSNVMKKVVKNIGQEQYTTFRESLSQYLEARSRLIGNIESVADFVGANVDKQAIAQRIGATERAFDSAIQSSVDAASNAAIKESNAVANGLYNDQKAARDRIIEGLENEYRLASKERQQYITEQLNLLKSSSKSGTFKTGLKLAAKLGAPVVGGLAAGPYGGALGGAYTVAASPVAVAKTLNKLNKARIKVSDKIDFVANALSGSGPVAVKTTTALGSFYSSKSLNDEYKRVEKQVRKLAANQDALEDQQQAMLGDLVDHAPNVSEVTKSVNATAIQYLENARPKPPPGLPPLQLATWEPIEADQRKFLRIRDAVLHPMETLDLAATGALLPEQVRAMDAVYPTMMQEVRARLLDRIGEKNAIPAKHRAMVIMLLGKDLDGRSQPARMIPTQSAYGAAPQQQVPQKPVPVSRIKDMNMSGRAGQETAAWREAQEGARLR